MGTRYYNTFSIQGEVESISLMKPKALTEHDTGMLEFLEEIIGTSRLVILALSCLWELHPLCISQKFVF
jgi:hypothetical protein